MAENNRKAAPPIYWAAAPAPVGWFSLGALDEPYTVQEFASHEEAMAALQLLTMPAASPRAQ